MAAAEQPAEFVRGRVGLQQRVLPLYRAPFVELLAGHIPDGMAVFAGQPLPVEEIPVAERLGGASLVPGRNRHFANPASPLYLCWQPGLLDWLAGYDPQVLVVEANPRYPSTRRAVAWMHARRRPVLGWGLGASPLSGMLGRLRTRERQSFLQRLDGVIAYSRRGAQEYIQAGMPAERVFVAPNAAAPRPTWDMPERPITGGRELSVLFVGRLQARKRLDLLFSACAALPQEMQPRLVVVGDGPAREEFERAAAAVYPRVTFSGALRGAPLGAAFREADLFVLPGTGGLAVQQALGYGLPVIVAKGDGTQDDMVRPGNGWLLPPGDGQALEDALRQGLSDPVRLRDMGRESYRIALEEINLERMAEEFARAIRVVQELGLLGE